MTNAEQQHEEPTLYQVAPEEVEYIWPHITALLETVLERQDGHSLDDIKHQIQHGQKHLWVLVTITNTSVIAHAVAVTQFTYYPQKTTLFIQLMAAEDIDLIGEPLKEIEDFARQNGCGDVEFWARPGLVKYLTDYAPRYVVASKQLGEKL